MDDPNVFFYRKVSVWTDYIVGLAYLRIFFFFFINRFLGFFFFFLRILFYHFIGDNKQANLGNTYVDTW